MAGMPGKKPAERPTTHGMRPHNDPRGASVPGASGQDGNARPDAPRGRERPDAPHGREGGGLGRSGPHPIRRAPEMPPYRPPSEAESVLVRVTRGCAWNRCGFCDMYKAIPFELRPVEDILADIRILSVREPTARSVFLADSDSLEHPHLQTVVQEVKRSFPHVDRITSYARLSTLRRLKPGALVALREAGLNRIHAGLESGSMRVLKRVRKALRPELAIEGARKAMDAGFELSLYILCGLGGEQDAIEHGRESGRLVGETWPHFLRLRSLVLLPGTPLMEEYRQNTFQPARPVTRLRELQTMLDALLTRYDEETADVVEARDNGYAGRFVGHSLEVCSDHFSNLIWADRKQVYAGLSGLLPEHRESILATLAHALRTVERSREAVDPGSLALRGRFLSMYAPTRL